MSGRRHGPRRETFELPDATDIDSINAAQVTLIRLVAEKRLGAREALDISHMLEHRRRAIGTATLLQKMEELEEQGRKIMGEIP